MARSCTRFAIDAWDGRLIEMRVAQDALVVSHACLFGFDLLIKRTGCMEGARASFVVNHVCRLVDSLIACCGVSGTAEINTLMGLAETLLVMRGHCDAAGSSLALVKWLAKRFEVRYGGIAGTLKWLRTRLALFAERMRPFSSSSSSWLRSSDFQIRSLQVRLFVLISRLFEIPKLDWLKCNDLITDISKTWHTVLVAKSFTELEESLEDDRAAALVVRCRSLFVLCHWDESFFVRESFFGATQLRALEEERRMLKRESLCDIEVLQATSRDPVMDVLNNSPMGQAKYVERIFEWTRASKL